MASKLIWKNGGWGGSIGVLEEGKIRVGAHAMITMEMVLRTYLGPHDHFSNTPTPYCLR